MNFVHIKKSKNLFFPIQTVILLGIFFLSCGKSDFRQSTSPTGSNGIPDDFMRGVDVSCLYDIEQNGGIFYDSNGYKQDMLELLAKNGVNWVRLRVWNNPENCKNPKTYNYGMCTIEKAASVAERAKSLGMKILLDFHYSDTWTEPAEQRTPSDWENCSSINELEQKIYDFTRESISKLIEANAKPDIVQIGNEINTGLLLTNSEGILEAKFPCNIGSENYTRILNSASKAIRDIDQSLNEQTNPISVMLHFADGGNIETIKYCTSKSNDVDYDIIGLSYYPFFKSHKSAEELGKTINYITQILEKKCIVAETSFAWVMEQKKWDNVQNVLWYKNGTADLAIAYENLQGIAKKYGIESDSYLGEKIIAATPQNQKAVLNAIIDITHKNSGSGVFYWGGEWVYTDITDPKQGSTWENQALFDLDHKLLPAVEAFGKKYF